MKRKPLHRAIAIAGSQAELARRIGKNQQDVHYWLHDAKKGVPAEHAAAIEQATGGIVKREELRPDIFGE